MGVFERWRERDLLTFKKRWSICSIYCRLCSDFNISVEVFNRKEVQEPHFLFLVGHWELPYLTIWEVL
jgi:hypothetical protein